MHICKDKFIAFIPILLDLVVLLYNIVNKSLCKGFDPLMIPRFFIHYFAFPSKIVAI